MALLNRLVLVIQIPLFTIIVGVICSQYVLLAFIYRELDSLKERYYQEAIDFQVLQACAINLQITQHVQYIASLNVVLSHFMSLVTKQQVRLNQGFFNSNKELCFIENDQQFSDCFMDNPLQHTCWYSNIEEVNSQESTILYNSAYVNPLVRSFVLDQTLSQRSLRFNNMFIASEKDSLVYSTCNNFTYPSIFSESSSSSQVPSGQIEQTQQIANWFKKVILPQQINIITDDSSLTESNGGGSNGTYICSQLNRFSQLNTLSSPDFQDVLCFFISINQLSSYFSYFVPGFDSLIILDPQQRQTIYNSKSNITSLTDEQQEDIQKLITEFIGITEQNESFYLRNFTVQSEDKIIFVNPIFIQYQGFNSSQNNENAVLLQIAVQSAEMLSSQLNYEELQDFKQNYILITSIMLALLFIFVIAIAVIYSFRIKKFFNDSIEPIILLLREIQIEKGNFLESLQLHRDHISFSKDTHDLYEGLLSALSILLSTSENFFHDNETNTLLRFHSNIEFFKKFGNNYAVGITYNNIGSILLQQGHYFEALEQFQRSILYAKYSIQDFCQNHPESISAKLLEDYCLDKEINELNQHFIQKDLHQDECINEKPNVINFVDIREQRTTGTQKCLFKDNNTEKSLNTLNVFQTMPVERTERSTELPKDISEKSQYNRQNLLKNEDFYRERIELLTTLFYRKRNYIIALQSFQENCDEKKKFKRNNDKHCVFYDFWLEIKILFKRLIKLARELPYSQYQEIKLLTHLSKCQYHLGNYEKSTQILFISKTLLSYLKKSERKSLQTSIFQNQKRSTFHNQSQQNQLIPNFSSFKEENISTPNKNERQVKEEEKKETSQKQARIQSKNSKHKQNRNNYEGRSQSRVQTIIFQNKQQGVNESLNTFNSTCIDEKHKGVIFLQGSRQRSYKSFDLQKMHEYNGIKQEQQQPHNQQFQQQQILQQQTPSFLQNNSQRPHSNSNQLLRDTAKRNRNISIDEQKRMTIHSANRQSSSKQIDQYQNVNRIKERKTTILSQQCQQMKQQKELNIEKYFENRRRLETETENNYLFLNYLSIDTLDSIISMTEAEILMMKLSYREAAVILTELLEEKLKFMSHYPYKIVSHLKQMFKEQKIFSRDLNQIYQKFNNQITLHIQMVFACKNDSSSIIKSIYLASNIVSNILSQKEDTFGIILQNYQDLSLQSYLPLINSTKIKKIMNRIIEGLQNSISNNRAESMVEMLDLISNNSIENSYENETSNQSQLHSPAYFKTSYYTNGSNSHLITQQHQHSRQIQYTDQNSQDNLRINTLLNDEIEENPEKDGSFPEESNSLKQYIVYCQPDVESEIRQATISQDWPTIENRKTEEEQYPQKSEDGEININIYQIQNNNNNNIYNGNITESQENDRRNRNFIFHMCIIKSISELYPSQIDYQFLKNKICISDQQSSHENLHKKYIVFCTDKIDICRNTLFEALCSLLSLLNLQIIIYSTSKGNNFLEQAPDMTYNYKEKAVMRVFYSTQKVLKYFQNCRNSFSKCAYPTIVQHF